MRAKVQQRLPRLRRRAARRVTAGLLIVVAAISAATTVSFASGEAVSGTSVTLANDNATTALTGVAVTGYTGSANLLVTVSTTIGTLSMSTASGLTLSYGYSSFSGSSFSFTGKQTEVDAGLATLKLTDSGTLGTAKVTVGVTVNKEHVAFFSGTNHFYEYVAEPNKTIYWTTAKKEAEEREFDGQKGYLATIPDSEVNSFIEAHLENSQDVWAGGMSEDFPSGGGNGEANVKRVWKWTGGPLAGKIFTECKNLYETCEQVNSEPSVYGHYHDWVNGEPNNAGYAQNEHDPGEHYLEINTGGGGQWNDLSNHLAGRSGYVVEYGNSALTEFSGFYSAASNVTMAAVPGTPVVTASGGSSAGERAVVSWTAPAENESAITKYTITPYIGSTAQTAVEVGPSTTSTTITGLTNGTTYTFHVTATNAIGTSTAGVSSVTTVYGAPGTPSAVTANGASSVGSQAAVKWTAAATNGSAVTGYTVTSSPGNKTCTTTGATECTVTGLTNGETYTFKVTATSSGVSGSESSPSAGAFISGPPGAPTSVTATAGPERATVKWSAPASNGASAITAYTVTSTPGSKTCTTTGATECTVTGLTNGQSYTFAVTATNANATGPESGASNSVIPGEAPGAPTAVHASAASVAGGQAEVSWTAPVNTGGASITGYTVTASPGGRTCTSTSATTCTVTGLTNGTTYTFTVTATNSHGTSVPSSASTGVTVLGAPGAPAAVSAIGGSTGGGQATIEWIAPLSNGGSAITGYTITPYLGATALTPVNVGANERSATIAGLTTGSAYTFKVTAKNAQGTGPAATTIGSTTIVLNPAAPTAVTPTPGYGTLTVSFQPPPNPPGNPVTGYEVSLDGGATWQTVTTTAAAGGLLQTTLSGLTEGATYSLLVRGETETGFGTPSSTITVTLPMTIVALITPPKPATVATVVRSHRIVKIHWVVPPGKRVGPFTVTRAGRLYRTLPARDRIVHVSFVGMTGPAAVKVRVSTRASTGAILALTRTFHICEPKKLRASKRPVITFAW